MYHQKKNTGYGIPLSVFQSRKCSASPSNFLKNLDIVEGLVSNWMLKTKTKTPATSIHRVPL